MENGFSGPSPSTTVLDWVLKEDDVCSDEIWQWLSAFVAMLTSCTLLIGRVRAARRAARRAAPSGERCEHVDLVKLVD